jgi:hypothetical protein
VDGLGDQHPRSVAFIGGHKPQRTVDKVARALVFAVSAIVPTHGLPDERQPPPPRPSHPTNARQFLPSRRLPLPGTSLQPLELKSAKSVAVPL